MEAGEKKEITGVGGGPDITAKPMALELPPPGAALNTVTFAVVALATLAAGMAAVSRVLLTKVVVRVVPFHCTAEPETKFEPSTVRVKPEAPTMALDGPSAETTGTGLLTVKGAEFEVPPPGPGLTTFMLAVLATATSLAKIDAVSCVLFTNVVERSEPFQRTTEVERKFEPFTVKESDWPPDITAEGDNELILGAELLIGWLLPSAHPFKNTPRSKPDSKGIATFVFMLYLAAGLWRVVFEMSK